MDEIEDTEFSADDMEELIFYLNQILKKDYRNFTITLGIRIFCEDNYGRDRDTWDNLYIINFSLQFTYEKIIDQYTYISWNQDGNKLSDLSPENYTVFATRANLRFNYS